MEHGFEPYRPGALRPDARWKQLRDRLLNPQLSIQYGFDTDKAAERVAGALATAGVPTRSSKVDDEWCVFVTARHRRRAEAIMRQLQREQ